LCYFFFQAEDGIRDFHVTGVQTCALPIWFDARLSSSFLSLMVGYLINLIIPRGGEISRSYNLYKLDRIPVPESFGTVVIERIIRSEERRVGKEGRFCRVKWA